MRSSASEPIAHLKNECLWGERISVTATQSSRRDLADEPTITLSRRRVTLRLVKSLVARGKVSMGDGFTGCAAIVPVKVQRRVSGRWRTVGSTTTSSRGSYRRRIPDRPGKYREGPEGCPEPRRPHLLTRDLTRSDQRLGSSQRFDRRTVPLGAGSS